MGMLYSRPAPAGLHFLDLLNDAFTEIRRHLTVRDRIWLRCTCRRMYAQDTDMVLPVGWRMASPTHDQRYLFLRIMQERFHIAYAHAELNNQWDISGIAFEWPEPIGHSRWYMRCTWFGHPIDDTRYNIILFNAKQNCVTDANSAWWENPDDPSARMYTVHGLRITDVISKHIHDWQCNEYTKTLT